jgi:sugar phosphate isomerase/epimerase
MNPYLSRVDRRQFVITAAAAGAAYAMPSRLLAAKPKAGYKFCAFAKFLHTLSFDELADAIASAGFDGVEVTARATESCIHPDRAADELPHLKEALAKHDLNIMILTTDVVSTDGPTVQTMLRAAAGIGIKYYRLGFFRYDLKKPILPQVEALKPVFRDIAAMNREIGITGMYQNHSGPDMLGATVWDLDALMHDIPKNELGCVFDIRHAITEAGEAWPVYFSLMKPHLDAISVKDFRWNGRKSQHVPLGQGQVDPKYFKMLQQTDFAGPVSVHVEYLPKASPQENLEALKTDFVTLRKMLDS